MKQNNTTDAENFDHIELTFDSPAPSTSTKQAQNHTNNTHFSKENREASLKQELESLKQVNQVIENVTKSLQKAKDNVSTVKDTVNSASTLLETWTRIVSQAEHNQRLILNPWWQGASQDLAEVENEQAQMAQELQRRQMEEQQRREAALRKAEDDERKKTAGAAAATATATGRGGSRGLATGRGHNRFGSRSTVISKPTATSRGVTPTASRAGGTLGWNNSVSRGRGTRGK